MLAYSKLGARRFPVFDHPRLKLDGIAYLIAALRQFLWWLMLLGGAFSASAVLQFDVFLGYDGVVAEASWFPVVCEIKNDGPAFTGTIEIGVSGNYNPGQNCRVAVELPTGTLKRIYIPVFCNSHNSGSWDARLL